MCYRLRQFAYVGAAVTPGLIPRALQNAREQVCGQQVRGLVPVLKVGGFKVLWPLSLFKNIPYRRAREPIMPLSALRLRKPKQNQGGV